MKEKISYSYTCEICHTNYSNKQKAIECEKFHSVDFKINEKRYRAKDSIGSNIDRFPFLIVLEDEKGNKAIYRRTEE